MGFISTIQHEGRLFIAGQPRRAPVRYTMMSAARLAAAANDESWQTTWPQVHAVATTLWQAAKRNVLAAVERIGPESPAGNGAPAGRAPSVRPLRVLHVVDPAGGGGSGRMVISGRMADVCAELERLAACEARHARC